MSEITGVVRYKTPDGCVVCLRLNDGRGARPIRLVPMDAAGIRIKRLPRKEERFLSSLDYPISRAKRRFRDAVRDFNGGLRKIAKPVREILK